MSLNSVRKIISSLEDPSLLNISSKILDSKRITVDEGEYLLKHSSLSLIGVLANFVREQKNGIKVFFNRNLHIEPTNICVYDCDFCSYARKMNQKGWEYSPEEIIEQIRNADADITEVHIVGGVHPDRDLHYYGEIMKQIRAIRPHIHIKGFTAVEVRFMAKKSGYDLEEGMRKLMEYGLQSMPGGGAEIFDKELREEICGKKDTAEEWLNVHAIAHKLNMKTNATILYGHKETYRHRIEHLDALRQLQDKTNGFNAFIPLKFKNKNNRMSHLSEVSAIEDLKNYAISRIYLDNFPHIKAYWPMIGKSLAQTSLDFGVDDLDGTINDSTKIYSMAGSESNPSLTTEEMLEMIKSSGKTPVERDSVYNELKVYN